MSQICENPHIVKINWFAGNHPNKHEVEWLHFLVMCQNFVVGVLTH